MEEFEAKRGRERIEWMHRLYLSPFASTSPTIVKSAHRLNSSLIPGEVREALDPHID